MNIFIKNKTDKKLLNIIVFMFFFIASITAYAVEPTLYASFDNDLNAVRGSVKIPAGSVLFPSLKKGKYGNALESGLLKGYITYPTNNVINVNEGTVELWVNPVDWTPDDNNFHVFFDVRGQGAFYLYKYYQDSKLLMLSTLDRGNGPYYSSSKIVTWKQGEWHHIAGTWSASGILLYVDGVPVSSQPVDAIFPKNLEESFTIGDIPWSSITSTKSLIDELRIYDKALTPRQILAHYNNDFNSNVFSEAAIKTSYVINKKDGVIDYSFSSDTPLNDKKLDVKLEVKKNNSSVYKSEFTLDNSKNDTNQYVPLKDFSPGEYTLISSVFLDGKLLTTKEMSVVIPDEAWLSDKNVKTTDLEMSAVPKPWTPLSISENVLDLWGRQYSFVESALPNQLASNGKNLLSAPISIAAKSLFNTTTLKSTPAVFNLNAQKSQVEITSKFYKSNIDETVLYVTNKTEFDGLSTITLTVPVSKNSLSNESLIIDIPLENVKYKHKWEEWGQWNKDVTGLIPSGTGVVEQSAFVPFYWLGDDDTGVFWFAETGKMWPNAESSDAIQLVRKGSSTVLRLTIKTADQVLPNDWTFTFGLQATPVKPYAKNWRKWRIAPAKTASIELIWPQPMDNSLKYYGYPEAKNEAVFKARVKDIQANGKLVIPYICPTFVSTQSPEWPFWKDNWSMDVVDSSSADVVAYGGAFAMTSPVDGTWPNFISYKMNEFINKYDVNGAYYDNALLHGAYVPHAGLGYLKNGKQYNEYPILATRELYKKLYIKIKNKNPDAVIIAHMSGKVDIPVLSFTDAIVDGEQFRGKVADDYFDLLPLASFRAEFMGKQWGLVPIFIPEYDDARALQTTPTESLMTLLLLHDVAVWPIWSNVAYIDKVYKILDDFNVVGATFYPYFAKNPLVTTNNSNVLVSGYCYEKGDCLAIIGNTTKTTSNVNICLSNMNASVDIELFNVNKQKINVPVVSGCINTAVNPKSHLFLKYSRSVPVKVDKKIK